MAWRASRLLPLCTASSRLAAEQGAGLRGEHGPIAGFFYDSVLGVGLDGVHHGINTGGGGDGWGQGPRVRSASSRAMSGTQDGGATPHLWWFFTGGGWGLWKKDSA